MTLEQFVTGAFLVIAIVGFGVQTWSLGSLYTSSRRLGLRRTAMCRVGCAVIYIFVGINASALHWLVLQVSFAAFCITQATWQVNALLDVQLARQLTGGTTE
jgi:hypothetical protein